MKKLTHSQPAVRASAAIALWRTDDKRGVVPLISVLLDSDGQVRKSEVIALKKLGDAQAVEPLVSLLGDSEAEVRRAVAGALGELGRQQAIPTLRACLKDPDRLVRASCAIALKMLGDPQGMEATSKLLASDDSKDRVAVVGSFVGARWRLSNRLLSADLSGGEPWIDPRRPITRARVLRAHSGLTGGRPSVWPKG